MSVIFAAPSFSNSHNDKKLPNNSLTKLISAVYTATLQKCIENLYILKRILDPPAKSDLESEALSKKDKNERTDDQKKLVDCCTFLETSLRKTVENLIGNSSYDVLTEILQNYAKTRSEENMLIENKKKLQIDAISLNSTYIYERDRAHNAVQNLIENIGDLKDQVNDTLLKQDMMLRLVMKWEQSRKEISDHTCTDRENNLVDKIREKNRGIEQEERIYKEIVAFTDEATKDYNDAIEHWTREYNAHLKSREIDIKKIQEQIQKQRNDFQALHLKYEQHKNEINDYLAQKERKRMEAEKLERKIRAATRIQAWWRGTMFRRGLGPYRKKKGRGKKGSKEKGNK